MPTESFWRLESLRLTAFPVEPVTLEEVNWWQQVTGSAPDSSSIERRVGVLAQVGRLPTEAGMSSTLRLGVEALRIHWNMLPPEDTPMGEVGTIGRWESVVPLFATLMEKWFQFSPSVKRLAFGAVLHREVSDVKEGYQRLAEFLPFGIDPESSEFLYQTNKRVGSKILDGLQLNRLTKWSVARLERITLSVPLLGSRPIIQSPLYTACRLELDINTVPEGIEELPRESMTGLWEELGLLGRDIADHGVKQW